MCGIIGCAGRGEDTLDTLVHGLSKLEYRGYDSAGVALADESLVTSASAPADRGPARAPQRHDRGGHRRDGPHALEHARPADRRERPPPPGLYRERRRRPQRHHRELPVPARRPYRRRRPHVPLRHGHGSRPHLVEDALSDGLDPEAAFRQAVGQLEGSYAVALTVAGTESVFVARNDSPLVLGLGEDSTFFASDVPAFRDFTDQVVYLDDGEYARISPDGWEVSDVDGTVVEKEVDTVSWDPEETGKSGYDHYMLKEIHEQPRALRQCLRGRVDELSASVDIGDLGDLSPTGVQFVACGTSYHAAFYAAQLFQSAGIPAQAFLASEYATSPPPIGDALVVGVTQSGETADTLSALREGRHRGARTLAVTNVVGSTAARECDHALYIRAGPEIGVAASKTFSSQLGALNLLALATTRSDDAREIIAALRDLPGQVQGAIDDSDAKEVAEHYQDAKSYFFIGRGHMHPVALEGALKMKEITYKHAEGFAAGELKHGTLALVTEDTPVFATTVGDGEQATKTVGNVKEVEARDAPVVAVTDGQSDIERYADHVLTIPETHPRAAAVLANVQLQLAAYHTANFLGRSIDKPRNLAKSVTVE